MSEIDKIERRMLLRQEIEKNQKVSEQKEIMG